MTNGIKTPFIGAAYYPEDWPDDQIPYDIARMKEAGIRCARIGEFAWAKMEPKPGKFEFGWLHNVVDSLGKAGISVIMGTPTATPPIWFISEHPEAGMLLANGQRLPHGGRRHCCSDNPDYRAICDRIVEAMGREFGDDPNIIGWQLDNEILSWGCYCEHCVKRFHDRLRREYGTVEELNRRWNLNLFSQAYSDFDQVPSDHDTWHNPHLKYEWEMAHHDGDIDFLRGHAEILRRFTKAPIGTDMMMTNQLDHEEMTATFDVVQYNHYHDASNLQDAVRWFDFLRTIKDRPFWNTETAPNWNGSTAIGQFIKPEGFCRVNSWLPVALGGECNLYWLWRQHWAGHELLHGSILTSEGRPAYITGEVRQVADEFDKCSDFINGTKVKTPVAVHFSSHMHVLFGKQPFFHGNDYHEQTLRLHRAVAATGVRPDAIGPRHTLEGYKVLFSPMMMTLEDFDLQKRIREWVEAGGVWVAGPITDVRNSIGAHYVDNAMGMMEQWLGIRLDAGIPSDGSVLSLKWADGTELAHKSWVEAYSLPEGAESVASIAKGHSALNGKSVISVIRKGRGAVIVLGTILDEAGMDRIARMALKEAGVEPLETTGELVVVPREGAAGRGLVVCEVMHKEASLKLPKPMTDLITGKRFEGTMKIAPYDIFVLAE